MEKFNRLEAVAAPLDLMNIDTDMIIPKQFLKTTKRSGLGKNLFDEMRYDTNGNEIKDFVLNQAECKNAKILVAGDNFGCGSSREHAPWALLDFGIKCVIAPSFADIFYSNCFKNGVLPIKLEQKDVQELIKYTSKLGSTLKIDLENQTITGEKTYSFDIDEFKKHCLLNGLDDIGLTLQKEDKIISFEENRKKETPWL